MFRDPKFVAALTALSMAAVLSALDQTVVSTALPRIIASLEGAQLLGWVFTAYFLGATATVAATVVLSASWFTANQPLRSSAHEIEEATTAKHPFSGAQTLVERI